MQIAAAHQTPTRILVVEDEVAVAKGVQRGLEAEGFVVDIEHDGGAGLERSRQETYDLVVLDLMLPSLNGFRLCRALREADDWTPVLMLTAKTGEWDEAEGLETGADDYLTKPFSMVVLVARVKALLRRRNLRDVQPYTAGDLRLDPSRHRCWRGDVPVDLTAREVEVLAHLFSRAGEAVPKEELLEAVWGPEFEGSANITEVYVGHLRRKLDEPFERRSIETIRGVGYRLDPEGG